MRRINGAATQQNSHVCPVFEMLFDEERFASVLEVGTGCGGFAMWLLSMSAKYSFQFETIDITEPYYSRALKGVFQYQDAMDRRFARSFFSSHPGPRLVLLDNGRKIDEFHLYARYALPGDILMTHDFAPDRHYFRTKTQWKCLENTERQLRPSRFICERHRLAESFFPYAWSCYRKGAS
jgi:hypothetical protein